MTATATVNPHLVQSTYGEIKPGDRVVKWPLSPSNPNAHVLARPVREILGRTRNTGFTPNWALPRNQRTHRPWDANAYSHFDYQVIDWRDSNGSRFDDRADEPVWIVPADAPTA
ncbi:hypothetical protein [Streptomyces sp. TRM68367]|uniref:hypothetical protein n=1 Tax=Streptomyces sp. TRM68367 TaxID=2758415 RepID=UPI00165BA070|nr:hypothetical protein [Streptomyces sp. TRM68367]MBC9730705.1 hypothetical protein [Streptomyces sp. TRM68367]